MDNDPIGRDSTDTVACCHVGFELRQVSHKFLDRSKDLLIILSDHAIVNIAHVVSEFWSGFEARLHVCLVVMRRSVSMHKTSDKVCNLDIGKIISVFAVVV